MKTAFTYISLFVIFSILFVLPSVIFPLPLELTSQQVVEPLRLLALLLTDFFCALFLIKRIELRGMKLFLAVVLVFWGLQTFMTQIETWYFREAMPAITNEVLLKLFINPLITALAFTAIAMWMLGKWKQASGAPHLQMNLKSDWKAILTLSVTYLVIYQVFGYYVAWQFEEVRVFYSGSAELPGFIEQLGTNIRTYPLLMPFQILRGFLWILCGLPVLLYLKGNRTEKLAACFVVYSILPCIQLIIDNPFMPADVRVAHLLEVATSNGMFGLLVGYVFTRRLT